MGNTPLTDRRVLPPTVTDGKVNLPAGITSFFVSVPTIQDTIFEVAEYFGLTATITDGKSASET